MKKDRATRETPMLPDPLGGRDVAEWIGKTQNSRAPATVRARVFARYQGRCHVSGLRIKSTDEWDLDHIKPLEDGGENRELNLAPILRDKHRQKTGAENSARKKADRIWAKNHGQAPPPTQKLTSRNTFKRRWAP